MFRNKKATNENDNGNGKGKGNARYSGPVSTITNQLDSYITVRNIENDTSFKEKDWPIFGLKELLDNAYDCLNYYYPSKTAADEEIRKIAAGILTTTTNTNANASTDNNNSMKLLHIAVRNSNVDNIPVFQNLDKTFDYNIWYSTKRGQHGMSTGGLGDALKRCLGMGYASWTDDYNPDDESLEDKQWEEPMVMRFNGFEYNVFIVVNRFAAISIQHKITKLEQPTRDIGSDTEVEVTFPIMCRGDEWDEYGSVIESSLYARLEKYFNNYTIPKSRTSFSLQLKYIVGDSDERETKIGVD